MNKHLTLCLLALLPLTAAAQNDDFGMWGEFSVTKRLPYNFSVGIEAEVRGNDNMQHLDRWNLGLSMGYKPFKWLKFAAGYSFIHNYKPESIKDKYKGEDNHPERIGNPEYWKGYNLTESYFSPRHRIVGLVTFTSPKLWRWVRVSLRERYQFTWRGDQEVARTKFRFYKTGDADCDLERDGYRYNLDGEPEHDFDLKAARHSHTLRSRLKVEMDKKHIDWHPFVSFESFNDLEEGFRMSDYRISAGVGYDITRDHSVGMAYIYNVERFDDNNQHVLSFSYEYKF